MNARFDRLHADLADLAEQVTVVDLRDRSLRTSRNLGRRRTLVAAAAAVAVLALGAGAAFVVLPGGHTALPVGPGSSNQPSAAATSPTSPQPHESDPVPGMYLYLPATPTVAANNDILYRPPGGDWRKVATVPAPPQPSRTVVVVSPDHQHIATLSDGTVRVSALDGSQATTVATDIGTGPCQGPRWTADSRQLLITTTTAGRTGYTIQAVDLDGTGPHTVGTTSHAIGCGPVSSDGSTVYAVYPGALLAFDTGTAPRTVAADWPPGQEPRQVIAASPGSTRLLVATGSSADACHCSPLERYAVVDTATGRVTRLDNANDKQGSAAVSGAFTADGRVVLLAAHSRSDGGITLFLTVFGPDGTIVGNPPLPTMEYGYFVGIDG